MSWCFGHLAEYASSEIYDKQYAKWDFSDFPIIPEKWELTVAKDKKGQLAVLKKLLCRKDLEYVVNACDADNTKNENALIEKVMAKSINITELVVEKT